MQGPAYMPPPPAYGEPPESVHMDEDSVEFSLVDLDDDWDGAPVSPLPLYPHPYATEMVHDREAGGSGS